MATRISLILSGNGPRAALVRTRTPPATTGRRAPGVVLFSVIATRTRSSPWASHCYRSHTTTRHASRHPRSARAGRTAVLPGPKAMTIQRPGGRAW